MRRFLSLVLFTGILFFGLQVHASILPPTPVPFMGDYGVIYNSEICYYDGTDTVCMYAPLMPDEMNVYVSGNDLWMSSLSGAAYPYVAKTYNGSFWTVGYYSGDSINLGCSESTCVFDSAHFLTNVPIYIHNTTGYSPRSGDVAVAPNYPVAILPQLTINIDPPTGGSVTDGYGITCASATCQYPMYPLFNPTLQASANYNWVFSHWKETENPLPLTLNTNVDKEITAIFVPLPAQVLSPVEGPLGKVATDSRCNALYQQGKWCFDQHGTGAHVVDGGIGDSDDSNAWDANWNYPAFNSDNGKPVYAVENGTVAQSYAGSTNAGGTSGQVLIEHSTSNGVWWSGYLHLGNIQVHPGDPVTSNTVIGYVSQAGTDNDHLHFIVYTGENSHGNLKSIDVPIVPR